MRSFLYTLDYAVKRLLRRQTKNISIAVLFALMVFLFTGIDFMSNAVYQQTLRSLEFQPSIIVQNIRAGSQVPIELSGTGRLRDIFGVSQVRGRVWGYYFDPFTGANYTVVGDPGDLVDRWELVLDDEPSQTDRGSGFQLHSGEALVGKGVAKVRHLKPEGMLNFQDYAARPLSFRVKGTFASEVSLWTHDLIVIPEEDARQLLGIESGFASDLAVQVPNEFEIPKVGEKIIRLMPGARVIAVNQLKRTYGSSYGFRSGVLLCAGIVCLLAFLILAYDRVAGLSQEEHREIAILKAVGWQTSDVIRLHMLEGLLLALLGFLLGAVLSYYHVFVMGAPLLRTVFAGWSVLYPPHPLPPALDLSKLFGLMFLTVVPYMAVGIVPVWRASVKDPEEVFRS